jgi:spore coat polysaccharide biosynthesis protein SpsF
LTADNPLVDGTFLDFCLSEFFSANPAVDYLDTGGTPRFPKGLSVEVMTAKALEDAWRDDHDPATREHVTLFIKAHPERFSLTRLRDTAENFDLWWTVDTEEDLQRARRLYDALQLQNGLPRHIELERRVRESGIL